MNVVSVYHYYHCCYFDKLTYLCILTQDGPKSVHILSWHRELAGANRNDVNAQPITNQSTGEASTQSRRLSFYQTQAFLSLETPSSDLRAFVVQTLWKRSGIKLVNNILSTTCRALNMQPYLQCSPHILSGELGSIIYTSRHFSPD